jgi:hypothetical protein
VIRFTAVQIEHEPLAVLARLAQSILAQTRALASSFPEFDVGARS